MYNHRGASVLQLSKSLNFMLYFLVSEILFEIQILPSYVLMHSIAILSYSNNTSYCYVSKFGTGYMEVVYMSATFHPLRGVHSDGRTEVEDKDKLRKLSG
jgi:hypothetical protein